MDCSLYDPLQSPYRKNHSTEIATLKLCNDVITGLDLGHCTLMASLDLSAAFDTVDHTIFLRRLQTLYCVNGTVIEWFKSYLRHRQHKVSINGILSTARTLKGGVPQGSVLEARMYSMYVKPLSDIMNRHNVRYHTYADDIQLYITCENNENSIEEVVVRLQDCISEISVWMSQNALKINEDKTKFIIFRKRQIQLIEVNLIIGNNLIPCEESIKILGFLTEHATKILMTSTVLTRLDYCNSTYAGLPQKSMYKLQLAQNTAARVVARIPRHHHITPTLQLLKWLPINKRCQFQILVMTFKALHSQVPSYMCEIRQCDMEKDYLIHQRQSYGTICLIISSALPALFITIIC